MTRLRGSMPVVLVASMTIFAAAAAPGAATPGGAGTPAACTLVNAARASALFGLAVTTVDRPNPISAGSSTCMYMVGGRPVMQLAITVMQSEGVAQVNYRNQQHAAATHKNVGSRQKGNLVLSAITMNGDVSKMNALLDVAVKSI